jgi:serine/threonine-protein kinase
VLEKEIGSGGMSRVFLGRDEVLDRPVAVKVLKADLGRTAAKLSHPVIVRVYDAGESEFEGHETSYIVMEYVPGGDLKDFVDEHGALSSARLAAIGESVAAGLAHAHERGIVHRDIKPHNILMDEKDRPRLTDFGIARALDSSQATRTGAYLGTALYSAPEQLKGEKVTPKSDVYSLGVTLYEAATGVVPFTGSTIEVATQHVNKEPTPPVERGVDLDAGLEALILACLAKDPNDRPSAEALQTRLAALKSSPAPTKQTAPAAPPPPTTQERPSTPQSSERLRRNRGLLALLALLAVLAVIGALAIPSLLNSDTNDSASRDNKDQNKAASDKSPDANNADAGKADANDADGENASGNEQDQPVVTEQTTEQTTQPEKTQAEEQPDESGGLNAIAAEQTIRDHYAAAADNPDAAWDFLSSRYQNELGAPEAWTGQFGTLEQVEFTRGPTAQVDGDTATVSFSTRATHTDRVDEPSPTATLVQENGEWKIDGLS